MATTVTLPDWTVDASNLLYRNWQAIIGILAIAVVTVIVSEVVKRKASLKHGEARVKKFVRWTVLAVSSGFTTLGYLVVFLKDNQSILSQIPYIAEYVPTVIGVTWMLYQFRLRKDFKTVLDKADTWSKTPDASVIPDPVVAPLTGDTPIIPSQSVEQQPQRFEV